MQNGRAKKKWAVPSPFLLLIEANYSRKTGGFEVICGGPDASAWVSPRRPIQAEAAQAGWGVGLG
jgi:hypothetical protein